jgi:hypothetical protein
VLQADKRHMGFRGNLVTRELADAMESGTYPPTPPLSISIFYVPEMSRPHCLDSEGMMPLDNRHVILQCYEAFKKFISGHLN